MPCSPAYRVEKGKFPQWCGFKFNLVYVLHSLSWIISQPFTWHMHCIYPPTPQCVQSEVRQAHDE